jgi:magnesium-transporting ATPase (P-type)
MVVGDLVFVREEEMFAADMIVLTASNDGGVSFI